MIQIIDYLESYEHRASGWIQDASSFDNLHCFVSAFSHNSSYRGQLLQKIQTLVEDELAQRFTAILAEDPIAIKYQDIVGTSPSGSRTENTVCNGIGQAALTGQRRPFQGDWPTNNFLRWALALRFVERSSDSDDYQITEAGEAYVQADAAEQYVVVRRQLLLYTPAVRVLRLLAEGEHTKFSLGEQLGFVGEKGFTNISEQLFVDSYFYADSPESRKHLKSDYEGSSDKYARQICSWLVTLGLADKSTKRFEHRGEHLVLPSYKITPAGREFVRKAGISSRRFVPFEMLSMESASREVVCKRRALILKALSEGTASLVDITAAVAQHTAVTTFDIEDDIVSLQKIGLSITGSAAGYRLRDVIDGLSIPRVVASPASSRALGVKERLRGELQHIDHSLLVLIDFAYGGAQTSRSFEVYVAKTYRQLYRNTVLLGGASKPDVVVSTDDFAMIIDAKAYTGGFGIPVSERDKMVRYVEEYKRQVAPWYKRIEDLITSDVVAYQFVSSEFGEVTGKLADITERTGVHGSALAAENLLRLVDGALAGKASITAAMLQSNQEIAATA